MHSSMRFAHTLAPALLGLLVLAGPASAQTNLSNAFVAKAIIRSDDVIDDFTISACISGTGIQSGTLTVPTMPTPTVMNLVADGSQFCVSEFFLTQNDLDTNFPNGSYTFDFTDGAANDSLSVDFSELAPAAFLQPTNPLPNANDVPTTGGLTLQWNIVETPPGSGCAAMGTCGDLIQIDMEQLDGMGGSEPVLSEVVLAPDATSTTVDENNPAFDPSSDFRVQLQVFNGVSNQSRMTSMGDSVLVGSGFAELNLFLFSTGALPLDVVEIGLFKLVERQDGVLVVDPYRFEACVTGTGIESASVTPMGASALPLSFNVEDDEFCFEQLFASAGTLDAAFPNGSYTFDIDGAAASDSKTLSLAAGEPGAFMQIVNPPDGTTVPAGQDLNYSWMLSEKPNGSGCIGMMSCADQLQVNIEFDEPGGDGILLDQLFATTDTSVLIAANELAADTNYDGEISAFNGTFNPSDMTDGADPVITSMLYEDINEVLFSVPEPGVALGGVAALATLGALRRRRLRA